jgi:hypothetical protein
MSESDHSRANDLFTDYQDKTLSGDDLTFLEGHLTICTNCKDEWQKYQQVMSALSGIKQKTPLSDAPDILSGTAHKINKRTRGLFFQKSKLGISYELITVLVLFLFAVAFLVLHLMKGTSDSGMQPMQPSKETEPKPKQGAIAPPLKKLAATQNSGEEPKPKGVVIEKYAFALDAKKTETTEQHLARIVLTASGKLSEWKETPQGFLAEYSIPHDHFLNFYKDLGASFTWKESKTTEVIAAFNPPVNGTLLLQKN